MIIEIKKDNMKTLLLAGLILMCSQSLMAQNACGLEITAPPAGQPEFYKKSVSVNGILIVGSEKVKDDAFCIAYDIVKQMTDSLTNNQLQAFIKNKGKVAIMAQSEVTTDIPEHSDLYKIWPGSEWDNYRGIGGTLFKPVTSCAEENLLCLKGDIYWGENILVHEFAHGLQNLAFIPTDSQFESKLQKIYSAAKSKGLWTNTYAGSNQIEYFAEAVQCWFNTNKEAIPTNGIHNEINTRDELKTYNPELFDFILKYFPKTDWLPTCDPLKITIK